MFYKYKLRFVYDDEEIHLPFCKSLYCNFEEFTDYLISNLMVDLEEADQYCKSEKK